MYHDNIRIGFWTENFAEEVHTYTHLRGWPVSDAEDDSSGTGYYLGLTATGLNGTNREVGILIGREALIQMLTLVENRFNPLTDNLGLDDPAIILPKEDWADDEEDEEATVGCGKDNCCKGHGNTNSISR